MNILSTEIEAAVCFAVEHGNEVAEVSAGWSKVLQVVHMKKPLNASTRSQLLSNVRLRHWVSEATPHDKAEEGFTDDQASVALSFPRH